MKKISKGSIVNIDDNIFDNRYLFDVFLLDKNSENTFFMGEELIKYKNDIDYESDYKLYSGVYSENDELNIFKEIFDKAIETNTKIHIVGITLKEQVDILEDYYHKLGYYKEDINCYNVDYSKVLVSASVNIENLIYTTGDYKRYGENIFFCPPVREPKHHKAVIKGINRGVIAGVYMDELSDTNKNYIKEAIKKETILPLRMGEIVYYNYKDIGLSGREEQIIVDYS